MKRRNFLKKFPVAASIPFTLGGIPMNLFADDMLQRMAAASTNNRVLVLLQLHGGNDGLNTLIPVEAYDQYYSRRANIAIPAKNSLRKYIPLDSTLPSDVQVGLHPDMTAMKDMYDHGRLNLVQGVSYKNNNGSHFRGRDIWFMGGGADDYFGSGWVGRFLQNEFAPLKYPDDFPHGPLSTPEAIPEMLDPLAIEMGNDVSLIFHQDGNIPVSISLQDPDSFFELVDGLEGFTDLEVDPRGKPPAALNPSAYFQELNWILSLEDKTKDYAARLNEVFLEGAKRPKVDYPTSYPFNAPTGSKRNPLTRQLQIVANLLAGGCKTKVFMLRIGGFDTHAQQVETYDPTMGHHAALLYHISGAMKAFHDDLRLKGIEDLVMSVTTSEFGRRIGSNGSYGTDHGTGGPVMIFGKGVQPGVVGKVPNMAPDQGNIEMQFDYRLLYANILKNWMGASDANLDKIFPGIMTTGTSDGVMFENLPIANSVIAGIADFVETRFALYNSYPNPAKGKTTIHFKVNHTNTVKVDLFDNQGKLAKVMIDEVFAPGEYKIPVDISNLPPGNYIYQMKTGFYKDSKKLEIIK
jgi:uncharacterized protein (DUF1501 family)